MAIFLLYLKKFFNYLFNKPEFILVTGADSSHYKSLLNFLTSVSHFEPNCKVVVYDLGFSDSEIKNLNRSYHLLYTKDLSMKTFLSTLIFEKMQENMLGSQLLFIVL